MLDSSEPVFSRELPDGLALRSAAGLQDVRRVAEFNGLIHGPGDGNFSFNLFSAHPATSLRDLAFIETAGGQVVASLCLIPWTLHYGPVDLPTGELGIVGTHPDYRKRGLNRTMMEFFWQRFAERGCLLSIIQGIPYYYRQFGYEYAHLQLEGGWRIQPDQIPEPPPGFTFRPATEADLPQLAAWQQAQASRLDLHARRSPEAWRYLFSDLQHPDSMQHETLVVLEPDGQPLGYLRLPQYRFHENLLAVDEVSEMGFDALLAVLGELKRRTLAGGLDGLRLNLPPAAGLTQLAQSLGAAPLGVYSWQVSVPDLPALLRRLAPLFEARLAGSMFAGLTRTLGLDLYRETLALEFAAGRLVDVRRDATEGESILSLPPLQFIPLVFGGRSLDEIAAIFPDASYHSPWKLLAQTLFPRTQAFFYTIY